MGEKKEHIIYILETGATMGRKKTNYNGHEYWKHAQQWVEKKHIITDMSTGNRRNKG